MSKPVILIHGAWHGAWCFDKLAVELQRRGIDVKVANLPLTGTDADIAAAQSLIKASPDAVVLGHSYGGLVMTHAVTDHPVSHLVYLAALMPDEGEDVNAKVADAGHVMLNEAIILNDDGTISVDPSKATEAFYHDCNEEDAATSIARLRPMTLGGFPILDSTPPWKQIGATYIVCADDRALHTDLQRDFSSRAMSVATVQSAHSPFLSQPEEIADLIEPLTT